MNEILDLFNYSFFYKALIMSIVAGISCGIIGVWILLLNISFIGVAMAHCAFTGALFGVFFNINPILSAFVFCAVSAILIEPISNKYKATNNVSIGVIFSFMLAISFLFISKLKDSNENIFDFLWGNILIISNTDIIINSILLAITILFIIICHRGIIAMLFNRELASCSGIPEKQIYYSILLLTSIIISTNIQSIGGLLIYGLILLPSVCAYQLTHKVSAMYIISAFIATISCFLGVFLSAWLSIPISSIIIIILTILLVLTMKRQNGN